MSTNTKRRIFLKGSLAAGAAGVALGAGLLTPQQVLAAWPKEAFEAKEMGPAMTALLGGTQTTEDAGIEVKAPDIAENGAVVPVTVSTQMEGVETITILAPNNPLPVIAHFILGAGCRPFASTRIKMGKTGDVVGVVKVGGKLLSAKKEVKVTIGGCGG